MKTRWKILIALGVFVGLLGLSMMMTVHFQPENQLTAYKKFLRDHGEKLEISEVAPPPVPAESNSMDAVGAAFRMFGSGDAKIPAAMKMVAPGKAMAAWQQPDVRGWGFTNSWDEFATDVEADRPAIALLHQVLARPRLDFQLDYQKSFELLLPQLAPMKYAAQKLAAAAVLDLHNDDPGAATTNILTLLALVHRNTSEGLLISHLVRIAMTAIAFVPTWELLQATNITDAQLAAVQNEWQQIDLLSDAEYAFEMERAMFKKNLEKARADGAEFDRMMGTFSGSSSSPGSSSLSWPPDLDELGDSIKYSSGKILWRTSWSYTEEDHFLQADQIMLETLRAMETNNQFLKPQYDVMQGKLSSLGLTNAGAAFFRALKIPDFGDMFGGDWMGSIVSKTIRIEAARRIAVTAIVLKRFQLQHGKWPETLTELVPEFISSVPIDPYDGKPLRYHPNADGTYLLYSVAEDGVDDGGDPTLPPSIVNSSLYWQNPKAHDWVWPQPATPAEIEYFREHPPK